MSVLSELRVKAAKAWPFQTLPPIGLVDSGAHLSPTPTRR